MIQSKNVDFLTKEANIRGVDPPYVQLHKAFVSDIAFSLEQVDTQIVVEPVQKERLVYQELLSEPFSFSEDAVLYLGNTEELHFMLDNLLEQSVIGRLIIFIKNMFTLNRTTWDVFFDDPDMNEIPEVRYFIAKLTKAINWSLAEKDTSIYYGLLLRYFIVTPSEEEANRSFPELVNTLLRSVLTAKKHGRYVSEGRALSKYMNALLHERVHWVNGVPINVGATRNCDLPALAGAIANTQGDPLCLESVVLPKIQNFGFMPPENLVTALKIPHCIWNGNLDFLIDDRLCGSIMTVSECGYLIPFMVNITRELWGNLLIPVHPITINHILKKAGVPQNEYLRKYSTFGEFFKNFKKKEVTDFIEESATIDNEPLIFEGYKSLDSYFGIEGTDSSFDVVAVFKFTLYKGAFYGTERER